MTKQTQDPAERKREEEQYIRIQGALRIARLKKDLNPIPAIGISAIHQEEIEKAWGDEFIYKDNAYYLNLS